MGGFEYIFERFGANLRKGYWMGGYLGTYKMDGNEVGGWGGFEYIFERFGANLRDLEWF